MTAPPTPPPARPREERMLAEPFDRELVPGSRSVDPAYRERQRLNAVAYRVKRRRLVEAPLQVGGHCVYRGDTELHRVEEIRDGVATIGRDGRLWPEACARLRGVRP